MIKIKIKCIKTEEYVHSKRHIEKFGEYITSDYSNGVKLDKEYCVYGILLYEDEIDYLIYDEYGQILWYAAQLFEVVKHKVPITWMYRLYGTTDEMSVSAIWGYEELVLSDEHYTGLVKRNKDDLSIFYKRKEEIDSFCDIENELEDYQDMLEYKYK